MKNVTLLSSSKALFSTSVDNRKTIPGKKLQNATKYYYFSLSDNVLMSMMKNVRQNILPNVQRINHVPWFTKPNVTLLVIHKSANR
jgi:hypothetical protein